MKNKIYYIFSAVATILLTGYFYHNSPIAIVKDNWIIAVIPAAIAVALLGQPIRKILSIGGRR